MSIGVVVADDQRIVREGLALVLSLLKDVHLLGAAETGDEALEMVERLAPDVVLMDLRMPGLGGVEATRRIRSLHPEVEVIVLTTYADDDSVYSALEAGARGYLTKDSGAEDLQRAIEAVVAGHAMFDPSVQARLVDRLTGGSIDDPLPTPDGLTLREVEVLRLMARGRSNEEIGAELFIGPSTVKSHINHIFAKIGVRDRAQAVAYAYRRGLVRT